MDFSNILVIIGCMVALWIVGKVFSVPVKAIFKFIFNSILGGLLIFIINVVGGSFNFHIGLNIGTSILVGLLGIPRSSTINYIEKHVKLTQDEKNDIIKLAQIKSSSDLPKMTKLNIDGKALYIHRADYIMLDSDMIK